MQALENTTIKGRLLEAGPESTAGTDPVEQDVGGWIFMPSDHFEALKRALEQRNQK